jgi:hypothetical protein
VVQTIGPDRRFGTIEREAGGGAVLRHLNGEGLTDGEVEEFAVSRREVRAAIVRVHPIIGESHVVYGWYGSVVVDVVDTGHGTILAEHAFSKCKNVGPGGASKQERDSGGSQHREGGFGSSCCRQETVERRIVREKDCCGQERV